MSLAFLGGYISGEAQMGAIVECSCVAPTAFVYNFIALHFGMANRNPLFSIQRTRICDVTDCILIFTLWWTGPAYTDIRGRHFMRSSTGKPWAPKQTVGAGGALWDNYGSPWWALTAVGMVWIQYQIMEWNGALKSPSKPNYSFIGGKTTLTSSASSWQPILINAQ